MWLLFNVVRLIQFCYIINICILINPFYLDDTVRIIFSKLNPNILQRTCLSQALGTLIILAFNFEIFNNGKYWNLVFDLSVSFSCSKLLVLPTEPGVLTCQVSSIIHYLLFCYPSWTALLFFQSYKHHQKNPPSAIISPEIFIPSSVQVFQLYSSFHQHVFGITSLTRCKRSTAWS